VEAAPVSISQCIMVWQVAKAFGPVREHDAFGRLPPPVVREQEIPDLSQQAALIYNAGVSFEFRQQDGATGTAIEPGRVGSDVIANVRVAPLPRSGHFTIGFVTKGLS
jgi:hypothetical protein